MNTDDIHDDQLDDLLGRAADDVRTTVVGDVPPFVPSRSTNPAMGVLAAAILVGGAWWGLSALNDGSTQVDTAVPIETTAATSPSESDTTTTADAANTIDSVEPLRITGFPVDRETRELVELDRPGFNESVIDPAFGSTITRVTESGPADTDGMLPIHSPASAWNADETMILLYTTGPTRGSGHVVIDAVTYDEIRVLDIQPADIEQVLWDPTDPDRIVFPESNELRAVSVATGASSTIVAFDECSTVTVPIGSSEPAWDSSLFTVTCEAADGSLSVATFQPETGAIATTPLPDGAQGQSAPSGDAVVVDAADGFTIYPADLSAPGVRIEAQPSGASLTAAADGSTLIVASGYESVGTGSIVTTTLDGVVTVIVGPDTGYPFPPSGTRLSGSSWFAPGLIAAASPTPSDGVQGAIEGELLVADLRGPTPVVHRVAHTRTSRDDYFASAFVSISPSGRFVMFSSDWGGGPVDTYIVEIGSSS